MKQQLIERIYVNHQEWLADLKKQGIDQVVRSAYEICYREEFICLLETAYLEPEEIAKLLKLADPVGYLYSEWLKTDASVCAMLEDVIADYLHEDDEQYDPCDNCNKPCCYGCPYAENEEENEDEN